MMRSSPYNSRNVSTSFCNTLSSLATTTSKTISSSISGPQTKASTFTSLKEGSSISIGGWIISIRKISKNLAFAVLLLPRGQGRLQLIARNEEGLDSTKLTTMVDDNVEMWEKAGTHGAVFVKGTLHTRPKEGQARNDDDVSPFFLPSYSYSLYSFEYNHSFLPILLEESIGPLRASGGEYPSLEQCNHWLTTL